MSAATAHNCHVENAVLRVPPRRSAWPLPSSVVAAVSIEAREYVGPDIAAMGDGLLVRNSKLKPLPL